MRKHDEITTFIIAVWILAVLLQLAFAGVLIWAIIQLVQYFTS